MPLYFLLLGSPAGLITFATHQKFDFYIAAQGESMNVFVTSLMVLSLVLYLSGVPNMKCSQRPVASRKIELLVASDLLFVPYHYKIWLETSHFNVVSCARFALGRC